MEQGSIKKNEISFFKRLKMAIFKLEDYGMFLGERLTVAFKYFFLLVLLISCIVTAVATYDFSKMVNKVYNYVENEMPDFEYQDGIASVTEIVDAYDHDYNFRLFVNTSDNVSEDTIKEYKNKIYSDGYGIIVLKDTMICISESSEIEEKYVNLTNEYDFGINNKEDLIAKLNEFGKVSFISGYFIFEFIALYITNIITILGDICIIAIFGWIAARICGVNFKMSPMIALAIYSLSLSMVLSGIYNCVFILTGFFIEYFNIIYLLIAYVYIIAAIFMIKYDLIKQTAELQKIIEVQKQVREELESEQDKKENKENKENKEDKENKENDEKGKEDIPKEEENREPDGSEI